MDGPPTVEAGDHTSEELLARLRERERLIVRADVLGSSEEMTLRFDRRWTVHTGPSAP